MKKLVVASSLLISFSSLACDKKVDPSKVIFFVDTNQSEMEIDTATKSACDRGQRLVVVPKNYKEYAPLQKAQERAYDAYNKCRNTGAKCETENQRLQTASNKFSEFQAKQPDTDTSIKQALTELKKENAKVKSFIISGHDGGGSFGGSKGGTSRQQISSIVGSFPDVMDVNSLLLLGCYTGVQNEIMEWKLIFPNVNVIAGYDGSAPLSTRPQGHKYIADILGKEKKLTEQANSNALMDYMKSNLNGFQQMYTAVYVQCGPGDEAQQFYYSSHNKSKGFAEFKMDECYTNPELKPVVNEYQKYYSGELEPPKDTATGSLRQLYNKARSLEHCFQVTNQNIDVNHVFNLLFYEGVKNNFAEFYQDDLKTAQEGLNLDLAEIVKASEEAIKKLEEEKASKEAELELAKNDPDKYIAKKEEELQAAKKKVEDFLNLPENAVIKEMLNTGMMGIPANDEQAKKVNEYYTLYGDQMDKKFTIDNFKSNQANAIRNMDDNLRYREYNITAQKASIQAMQGNSQILKDIWIPTKENLEKKSRKELLKNLNNINAVMSLPGIPDKQRQILSFTNAAAAQHLQYFMNPFSWHEHKPGSVETPTMPVKLENFASGGLGTGFYGSYGGGYSGGYGGGGMVGGFGAGQSDEED